MGSGGVIEDLVTDLILRERETKRDRELEGHLRVSILMPLTWRVEVLGVEVWAEREDSQFFCCDFILSVHYLTFPFQAPDCSSFGLMSQRSTDQLSY